MFAVLAAGHPRELAPGGSRSWSRERRDATGLPARERSGCIPTIGFRFTIETAREDDGRWIAEIPTLPGVLAYGATEGAAFAAAEDL